MTEPTMALQQYLCNAGLDLDGDFLRDSIAIALMIRLLMEAQVSEQIGVDRYERDHERQTHRNGYRERAWNDMLDGIETVSSLETPRWCEWGWRLSLRPCPGQRRAIRARNMAPRG